MDVKVTINIDGVKYGFSHEVNNGEDAVKFGRWVVESLDYHLGVKEASRYVQEMYN